MSFLGTQPVTRLSPRLELCDAPLETFGGPVLATLSEDSGTNAMLSPVCDQNISLWLLCVEERLRKVPDGGVKAWQIQDKLLRVLWYGAEP